MAVLVTAVLAASCVTPPPAAERSDALTLTSPGRTNANASTAAAGHLVVVTWTAALAEGGADVMVATSEDGGRSFATPVQANDIAQSVRTAGEQTPRVAVTPQLIAVVWTAREANRSVVRLATSSDRGRSFGASRLVHPADLAGARGWASVAIDSRGRVRVVWLDGRNADVRTVGRNADVVADGRNVSTHATSASPHAMTGTMPGMDHARAPRQDLYAATATGAAPISNRLIAADTCFCCKTTMATRADGSSIAAWRHLFPDDVRDIGITRFEDTTDGDASAPPRVSRVSSDNWELHGCPEDGPAVVVDAAGTTHVTWPTLVPGVTPGKGVFYASSADGVTFSPRVRLDTAAGRHAAHPQIAVTAQGRVAVVWEELGQAAHPIVMRTLAPGSNAWVAVALGDARGVYPAVSATGERFVVAWTNDAATHVRVLPE